MVRWNGSGWLVVVGAVIGALAGSLLAGPASAEPVSVASSVNAEPSPEPTSGAESPETDPIYGYYRTPWTSTKTIYESRRDGTVRRLTRAEWADLGRPPVTVAPVRYVRTSWSSSVYALLTWPHADDDTAVDTVAHLTPTAFRSAGSPRGAVVGHVPSTRYVQYASGPRDLHARTPDGANHLMTSQERRLAGSPSAEQVLQGGYYRAAWSTRVYFVRPDGSRYQVSAKTRAARGNPQVAIAPTVYARTPWSSTVHALITWPHAPGDRSIDQVGRLTSANYAAAGRPKTTVRYRIPGDAFVRLSIGRTIYHRVSGTLTPVTWSQWRAAGSPALRSHSLSKPMYIRDILIVNKSIPVPSSYGNGLRPELTKAFAKMRADARDDGVSLTIISGFRSYASQAAIYPAKIRQYGYEMAQLRAARPGHSEHQTGLAIDVNSISQAWGDTKAGRWVARYGHRYGFIVRYPKGKTAVTGYAYEPWHLRHVGVEVATHLKKTGLTLDEYLGVPSKYR
ncbi:M15 family metallopeptidase [Microbacterium dauci]|uniref:M15 family metallopeptidase n=1 Tax=Microbacterium dauci TaxID=3048008 RepID=A0ABT6ZFR8_9MICO|nr:M15 family metallopeptidase [Microbacterium sp. LX3-4]MDJ1114997.1 M15 family metallopeptidase [Microbacterium sp. LX3-4]